jgi:hypothetical protein
MVDLSGRHPRSDTGGKLIKDLGSNLAGLSHFFNLMRTLNTDHTTSLMVVVKGALVLSRQ